MIQILPPDGLATCLRVHEGQKRKDGKTPFATHPIRVALAIASFGTRKPGLLNAALFHDFLEDSPDRITMVDIEFGYGKDVLDTVIELTKTKDMTKLEYIASFSKKSTWACLIKLFDRLDNLRDWAGMDPDYKPAYAEEADRLLSAIRANGTVMAHTGGNFGDRYYAPAFNWAVQELEKEIRLARDWRAEKKAVPT